MEKILKCPEVSVAQRSRIAREGSGQLESLESRWPLEGKIDFVIVENVKHQTPVGTDAAVEGAVDQSNRELITNCSGGRAAWHPTYSAGWSNGFCRFTVDCNSPSYSSEVACCRAAYRGQITGFCLSQLPSPPTTSPTETGGLDVYYPDYTRAWPEGVCINTRPLPSGRVTYSTMLACCKGAYAGQTSGE